MTSLSNNLSNSTVVGPYYNNFALRDFEVTLFSLVKLFSHAFSFEGEISLFGRTISLRGWQRDPANKWFLKTLKSWFEKSKNCLISKEQQAQITEAFEDAGAVYKYKDKLKAGKVVVNPTGWEGHALMTLFSNRHYVICNGGEREHANASDPFAEKEEAPTLKAFEIDPKRLRSELNTNKLLFVKPKQKEKALARMYVSFPHALGGDSTARSAKRLEALAAKEQRAGNCSYFARKLALRALLSLLDIERPLILSKAFTAHARLEALDGLLAILPFSTLPHGIGGLREHVLNALEKIEKHLPFSNTSLDQYPHVKALLKFEFLDLANSDISDDELYDRLADAPRLKAIDLTDTLVTDEALIAIGGLCKHLEFLCISGCRNISAQAIDNLKVFLPDCKIVVGD
jgi:hypothetical protein